ncbi:NAD(P)-binding domain-containing protein [Longispora sp. NPDC051575]|uniref:NAD(P)-dependent oxidoreductase n=1 Tax=Longispora sp. NPDC051575 TaxID=3154943 RepID=UPI003426CD34
MPENSRIAVLGLGRMGTALAGALVGSGHTVTVWNRSPAKADALAARGARPAGTPAEAVASSPVVIVCVSDYATVRAVLDSGNLAGRLVVNLTNGTPEQARELAEWTAERGGDYLDGGIMAVPQMIGAPGALVLYSGSAAFTAHEPTLTAFGAATYLGADPGLAPLYDLALLSGMYGMLGGFLQAAALVGSERVPVVEFTKLLVPWVNAMTAMLPGFATEIDARGYATDVSSLDANLDALRNIEAASAGQGVGFELLAPVRALVERRVAAGHAADSLSSLIEAV